MRIAMATMFAIAMPLAACGDDGGTPDVDAGDGVDAGPVGFDAGPRPDAGRPRDAGLDAGEPDAGKPEPAWGCLGAVEVPTPEVDTATLSFTVTDFTSGVAIPGASVRGCLYTDPSCDDPVVAVTTDGGGFGSAMVDLGAAGFWGFVEVVAERYLPTLGFTTLPIVRDETTSGPLVTQGSIDLLAIAARIDSDLEANGGIAIVVQDCGFGFARGVTLDAGGAGDLFYLISNVPNDDVSGTDDSGVALVFNVPPGMHTIRATRESDGEPISAATIPVRAGHVHLIIMNPTPDGAPYSP